MPGSPPQRRGQRLLTVCMRAVRSLTEKEALSGLISALTDGSLDPPTGCLPSGRKCVAKACGLNRPLAADQG